MVRFARRIKQFVWRYSPGINTILVGSYIARRNMVTLETLRFDNLALRTLPLDTMKENFVREVNNSCFSLVNPSPVDNPKLVAHSQSAMDLLDLGEQEIDRAEFVEYFSGNNKLPGSTTAAHCYCGHQFGTFAGQLGDGAAIYLGEVMNSKGERWEIQLKGAGKTPYSRSADGRKVLRSSIREFLCSEAMHHLGVPTTRAGSCITSDTKVIRDIFYDGNPIYEKSTVVLRIAPTFIRFGSFEIFKERDMLTGRRGPSAGKTDILAKLLEYVIDTFYPHIKSEYYDNAEDRYLAFYKDIVCRTAETVALWQCIGFCHGVLNTDNMSIVGLTIDYGPFGFMDHYNSGHISNASDDMARYSYREQPTVCKWNLLKLAEALQEVLPLLKSKEILDDMYDKTFLEAYMKKMRKKLGIVNMEAPEDKQLIDSLLKTMEETGADFTNTFRCLSRFQINPSSDLTRGNEELLEYLLSQCLAPSDIAEEKPSSKELQLLMILMRSNPALASQFGNNPLVTAERERMEKTRKLREISPAEKREKDEELWLDWLHLYRGRIMRELDGVSDTALANKTRIGIMNENNPSFVLRNYVAESAIQAAEKGDYTVVRQVLAMLQAPYSEKQERQNENEGSSEMDPQTVSCENFGMKPPKWGLEIRVT